MASTTQFGVIRAAFAVALDAELADPITVTSYEPGEDDKIGDRVWIGDIPLARHERATANSVLEIFAFDVVCYSRRAGDGDVVAAAAETQALVMFAAVEEVVADNRTITGTTLTCAIGDFEVQHTSDPSGRICRATVRVTFTGELRR